MEPRRYWLVHQLPLVIHLVSVQPVDTSGAVNGALFALALLAAVAKGVAAFLMGLSFVKGRNFFAALLFGLAVILPASLPANSDAWSILFATIFTVDFSLVAIVYGAGALFNPQSQVHHEALGVLALLGGFGWLLASKGLLHL